MPVLLPKELEGVWIGGGHGKMGETDGPHIHQNFTIDGKSTNKQDDPISTNFREEARKYMLGLV